MTGTIATTIVLVVSPSLNADGHLHSPMPLACFAQALIVLGATCLSVYPSFARRRSRVRSPSARLVQPGHRGSRQKWDFFISISR
jgi:hypothetical protein